MFNSKNDALSKDVLDKIKYWVNSRVYMKKVQRIRKNKKENIFLGKNKKGSKNNSRE